MAISQLTKGGTGPVRGAREPEDPIMSMRIPAVAFQNVVGSSTSLRRAIHLGCKVANHSGTTVLIHGETGTGKELFARGIHYSSPNSAEPFVAINCSAIPETLLESELFGHEKGAFSGADVLKRGLLEFAGSGTVFLDEIGELPVNLQPKLLRVLEERQVRRVGGLREFDINCRIVAATNRDLAHNVSEGHFRADLFYRLGAFAIELPPLRNRQGDVDLLAKYYLDLICREHGLRPKRLSSEALKEMRDYNWPGNVRELKNAIEGALIVCDGDTILPEHVVVRRRRSGLAPIVGAAAETNVIRIPDGGLTLVDAERQLIEATLRLTRNNISKAARLLGISRPTILRKLDQFGLREAARAR